jgi:hypothetical protein
MPVDPNSDEYRLDYDHTEIDHDQDNREIKGHDFNPVEEGSALHLEIHRSVDELGKYAIEMEIDCNGRPKEDIKGFVEELMKTATVQCMENGADLVGHVKSFLIVGKDGADGNMMSSIVDVARPIKMQDHIKVDKIDDAILVLHVIVHGIWDDKIRALTLEVLPGICKKWNVDYKILADYFDLEKSIAHHNIK